METEKRYTVHSMFYTIQGEGAHAGKAAVFIRFSGCNLWDGREESREKWAQKAACAGICDTEFRGIDEANGGGRFTSKEIADRVKKLWGPYQRNPREETTPFVVLTGGEPTLQVDDALTYELTFGDARAFVAIETNGTNPTPRYVDWVTLSPKLPAPLHPGMKRVHELKVLYPLYDPCEAAAVLRNTWSIPRDRCYIQPVDSRCPEKNAENLRAAIDYCKRHPEWRLSVQLHKLIGVE